jgi:hypothetical protein
MVKASISTLLCFGNPRRVLTRACIGAWVGKVRGSKADGADFPGEKPSATKSKVSALLENPKIGPADRLEV